MVSAYGAWHCLKNVNRKVEEVEEERMNLADFVLFFPYSSFSTSLTLRL
jgi:hypothetical protein